MVNYNEFAESIKVKYPQYQDRDNRQLAEAMVQKYPEYSEKVTFDNPEIPNNVLQGSVEKNIDLTPSGLTHTIADNVAAGILSPVTALKDKTSIPDAFNKNKEFIVNNRKNSLSDFAVDMAGYSILPEAKLLQGFKGSKILNNIITGTYQGGLINSLEDIKNKGLNVNLGESFATGAKFGGGLPIVMGGLAKIGGVLPWAAKGFAKNIARIQPETITQSIKADSRALDLSPQKAQQLLADTTYALQNNFENILNKRGELISDAAQNLPVEKGVNANILKKSLDNIYDSYSTSGNENLNVAKNQAGNIYNDVVNMIDNADSSIKITGNELGDLTDKNPYQIRSIVKNYYKKNLQGKTVKREDGYNVYLGDRGIGKVIHSSADTTKLSFIPKIEDIIKNGIMGELNGKTKARNDSFVGFRMIQTPVNLNGEKKIAVVTVAEDANGNLFYNVNDKINIIDRIDYKKGAGTKRSENTSSGQGTAPSGVDNKLPGYTSPVSSTDKITRLGPDKSLLTPNDIITQYDDSVKVSAPELNDILKNLSAKTNWDKLDHKVQNEILERLYGDYSAKLSELSPELKQANKEYAALKEFQKNEGIRRILQPSDRNNIDTASTALKNFNNSITKGNTNNNIQELEKLMTDEGYPPFLNVIDDINASQDLNNIRLTGDSLWANLGTMATRPVLRALRGLNRSGIDDIYKSLKKEKPTWLYPLILGTEAKLSN